MRLSTRISVVWLALGLAFVLLARPTPARADAKADIEAKVKLALEKYDGFEYEEARKHLNGALTLAKRNKLEATPLVARVHLNLGIVYFLGLKDEESARLAFLSATQIDGKIQIDPAYKTAELATLLEEARKESAGSGEPSGGGGGGGEPSGGEAVDCSTVAGLQHTIVDTGVAGSPRQLEAFVGPDLKPAKVALMYRTKGEELFAEAAMTQDGCKFVGSIPGKAMRGDLLHYYIAAFDGDGNVLVSKGSEGSPNLVELTAASGGSGGSEDNPLVGPEQISGGVVVGGRKSTVFLGVAFATGAGYVTGKTEKEQNEIQCGVGRCFAPGLITIYPELGYQVSPVMSVSVVGRLGIPVGTNIEGSATLGPAGLLRLRYALSPTGAGLHVGGSIGGGIIRDTIELTMAEPDMNVDIVAFGPLLIGGNAGYAVPIGGSLRFNAEFSALAGLPVVSKLGESVLNLGVQLDVSLGLSVGF
ncbi:MAG: tetratricopeptide repeat protein [Kofleriaceae bacterium]|nr:tetratricopeptide repeat protein [Kofleriaceae bacterium]MBP6836560.1 tetratricopeptide repeat protein [Kofleriaceae bacterium]MBP9207472.1 tetratricopeptide repeat protein [Kofleriaceae bacterium]